MRYAIILSIIAVSCAWCADAKPARKPANMQPEIYQTAQTAIAARGYAEAVLARGRAILAKNPRPVLIEITPTTTMAQAEERMRQSDKLGSWDELSARVKRIEVRLAEPNLPGACSDAAFVEITLCNDAKFAWMAGARNP